MGWDVLRKPLRSIVINSVPGAPDAPSFAVTDPSCTSATGTITVTSVTTGLTFSFDGAPFIPYPVDGFTSVAPGIHTLIAQNASSCLSPVTNITVNEQPAIKDSYRVEVSNYNGFNISCQGQSNGYVNITTLSDPSLFTFEWSGPGGFTSSNKDVSALAAGQYSVTISDKNNCAATENITLTEPLARIGMTIDPSVSLDGAYNISCGGEKSGTINVVASNNIGATDFIWSDGGQGSNRTGLGAGTYGIIITDANNCQVDSSITLTEPDPIRLAFEVTNAFCPVLPNGDIRLTVTGGMPGIDYNYLWSDNSTGRNLSSVQAGNYQVIVKDNNLCSVAGTVTVGAQQDICLLLNEAISPNNDGVNDVWNIGNIDLYPDMEITIYNRWGQ